MGSLIPSEMWDWRKDWPKVLVGLAAFLAVWGVIAIVLFLV